MSEPIFLKSLQKWMRTKNFSREWFAGGSCGKGGFVLIPVIDGQVERMVCPSLGSARDGGSIGGNFQVEGAGDPPPLSEVYAASKIKVKQIFGACEG
jgi:hypothetical protein